MSRKPLLAEVVPSVVAELVEDEPQRLVRYQKRNLSPPLMDRPGDHEVEVVSEDPAVEKLRRLLPFSHARRTRATYDAEWKKFEAWCAERNYSALPAHQNTVAVYIAHLADTPTVDKWKNVTDPFGRKPRGIGVAVAAIAHMHASNDMLSPHSLSVVQQALQAVSNKRGMEPTKKTPLLQPHVAAMIDAQARGKNELIVLRNKAIILVQWSGAFRRSELVDVTVEHVEFCAEGMRVKIPKSKTDQQGRGKVKAIPFSRDETVCPVRALRAWLDKSEIRSGYIFIHIDRWGNMKQVLTDHAVAVLVKGASAGVPGLVQADVSGHSARSGFVTVAARKKKSLDKIMAQTGHTRVDTVMEYVQDAALFDDAAASGLLDGPEE